MPYKPLSVPTVGNFCFVDTKKLGALDWNDDGWLDIIFGNGPGPTQVFFSNNNRTYPAAPTLDEPSAPSSTTGIVVTDLNHDGLPDFVETFVADPAIVWMNDGIGVLHRVPTTLGSGATDAAVGRLR